ncbi:predicted protein [Lichtheimia corymbifera JMRC:FSU:9682]|uniref:Uncharacterized protein n=1 Tax=Lichtheimia corymbifera JMRC:FSU:9682 TaxID=1263082 RepID=A0A068SD35_9FUNG|nr:predicted protein [Lichtheimia corymbifera JMRC:FSU:9682]
MLPFFIKMPLKIWHKRRRMAMQMNDEHPRRLQHGQPRLERPRIHIRNWRRIDGASTRTSKHHTWLISMSSLC